MHTNLSVSREGQESLLRSQGARTSSRSSGWKFIDRILASGAGHLPGVQPERQRLSPARSPLRGAQPDQGLGGRPRLDGPHSAGQREVGARRGAVDRARTPTRTWRSTPCSGPGSKGRMSEDDGEKRRDRTRFLPDNIYDAIRLFKGSKFMHGPARRGRCTKRYADLKLASGRTLPQGAGRPDQDSGDPVPPRGHEPVPLVDVLASAGRRDAWRRDGFGIASIFASSRRPRPSGLHRELP